MIQFEIRSHQIEALNWIKFLSLITAFDATISVSCHVELSFCFYYAILDESFKLNEPSPQPKIVIESI